MLEFILNWVLVKLKASVAKKDHQAVTQAKLSIARVIAGGISKSPVYHEVFRGDGSHITLARIYKRSPGGDILLREMASPADEPFALFLGRVEKELVEQRGKV